MKSFLLAALIPAALAAQSNPAAGSIEGRVFNSLTSVPVRKATVILSGPEVRLVAETDAAGTFQFSGVPPRTYKLSASRTGFLEHAARRAVILGPNDQVKDAEIRLPPQSEINGRVLDEEGEPVDRARVWVYKQVYRSGKKLWERLNTAPETNEAGEYRFPNLSPGRYLVQALDQRPQVDNRYGTTPAKFNVPAYYPNASNQQQAVPVNVGVGAEVRGIDIHLFKVARPAAVWVKGKVTGIPREYQATVSVSLSPADSGSFGGTDTHVTAPEYAFALRAPPGQYTLSASVYTGGPQAYGSRSLTVPGDLEGVVLAMNPAPDISGRISVAEKGVQVNLQNIRIVLHLSGFTPAGPFELRSDATGNLGSFPDEVRRPGHFAIVDVRNLPDGYFVREVKLAGQDVSPDDFEIGSSAQLEIVLSNTAGKIVGSVTDADGKAFPGGTATLIPAEGKSRAAKQAVDDAGKFQFANLRPGTYTLFAWEEVDDDLWPDQEFLKKYENRATEITVGPGEIQNAQLRLIVAEEMK
jgi:uncharacterized protein (DUF2141 family)